MMAQNTTLNSSLGAGGVQSPLHSREHTGSEILETEVDKIRLDKSNILLLGPTGSGEYSNKSEVAGGEILVCIMGLQYNSFI